MFQIYAGNVLVYEPGDYNLALLAPKLTVEMGKAGSLEFTVPAGHPYANELKKLTKPVSVDLDGQKIFRGRVLSGSRTFYNQREIYCEGVLSYLVDSVQKAVKFDGKTHALFRQIIANHNARMPAEKQFTVGNITVPNQDIHLLGQTDDVSQYDYSQIAINSIVDNWNTTYDYIETCLISYCGGYLMVRQVNGTNYIDWVSDYTSTATQEIVFGENLLDLTDESTAEDIFTVLIPLGDDNLTIKTVNGGSDELVDQSKVAKYGRIVKTNVFSNVSNAQTLLENGQRYLANNGDAPTTLTITAIDLHTVYPNIAAIKLGDRVYIRSDPHDLSQYLTCTKIEYDLEKPENTVYTFGREKQSLTQRYREDKRKESDTYGNTAGGGGGGIGASAGDEAGNWYWLEDNIQEEVDDKIEASEADQEEKREQALQDFYDAWINVSPEQGQIDLGALYRKVMNDEYVLEQHAGINVDAPAGTVNIFSTATDLQTNEAKTAQIIAWAGQDDQGNLGTRIALEADLVTVSNRLQAIEGIFSNITTETAYASKGISSHTFYGSNYYISSSGTIEVNLATHAHNIIATDDGNGLILTGPIALSARRPFYIADTQAYQEGVSAVVLTGLVGTSYSAEDSILSGTVPLKADTIYSGNMVFGCLTTTLSNGNTKTIRVGICSDRAYEAGQTSGRSDVILYSITGTTYTAEDSILSGTVPAKANTVYSGNMVFGCLTTTLNPTGKTRTVRVGINAEKAYDAGRTKGQSDVTLTGLAGTTYTSEDSVLSATVSSQSNTIYSGNMVFGCLTTTLSNGKTKTIRVGIHAGKAYTAGQNSITQRSVSNVYYESGESGTTDYGHIWVRFSNGTTQGNIPITNAYSIGYSAGQASVTPHYATFEVRAISPSGAYVYIYSSETGLMRLYEGDTFDQT